jgi:hypothetical protein
LEGLHETWPDIHYGYAIGAIRLISGWLGFDFLYPGLDAWNRGRGWQGLLISLPLLGLAFGLAYGSAAMTIGKHMSRCRT